MGLRCLLGHDFNEPEVEREREEDGNEVVTTVREVKTCARCGETQIVSENTEVTTMERLTEAATSAPTPTERADPADPTDPVGHAEAGPDGFDPVPDAEGDTYEPPIDGDDAVIIDGDDEPEPAGAGALEGGAEADAVDPATAADEEVAAGTDDVAVADDDAAFIDAGPDADEGTEVDEGTEADDEPATWPDPTDEPDDHDEPDEPDDGVILDDEGEPSTERERGAWPAVERDDESDAEPTPWPEQRGEDEGWNATIDDTAEGGDPGVEFGGGLTPEAAVDGADVDEDVEFIEAPETAGPADRDGAAAAGEAGAETGDAATEGIGSGIAREDPPTLQTSSNDVEMEYYCPACEMTREADGNSMRAGDICPSCKRGYINERPR